MHVFVEASGTMSCRSSWQNPKESLQFFFTWKRSSEMFYAASSCMYVSTVLLQSSQSSDSSLFSLVSMCMSVDRLPDCLLHDCVCLCCISCFVLLPVSWLVSAVPPSTPVSSPPDWPECVCVYLWPQLPLLSSLRVFVQTLTWLKVSVYLLWFVCIWVLLRGPTGFSSRLGSLHCLYY